MITTKLQYKILQGLAECTLNKKNQTKTMKTEKEVRDIVPYNYVRMEKMTEQELRQVYKKYTKRKLIDMLIENNRLLGMVKDL